MLKVDLHLHTADDPFDRIPYSTIEAIEHAADHGFSALAITLHERQLDLRPFEARARERGIVLIPGVERTIRGRHVLLINFPASAETVGSFDELADLKRRRPEGLVIAPHPFFPLRNCLRGLTARYADLLDAVEYNGCHTRSVNFNRAAVEWARARGKPMVGNSDAHRLELLGKTYSMIAAEPDSASICAAVRAGRTEVHAEPLSALGAVRYFASLMLGIRSTPATDPSTAPA